MPVPCFTREENNGIHVIFPIEGPMKQDCLLVNGTVQFLYEHSSTDTPLDELCVGILARAKKQYQADLATWEGEDAEEDEKPKEPVEAKVLFDTYRTLLNFRDHGICTYSADELHGLLPQGIELKNSAQIMPIRAARKTAEFLQRALTEDESPEIFFSLRALHNLPPNYFDVDQVIRRHLGQQEVYFIQLDGNGEINACVVVAGFAIQPHSLTAVFIAGDHPNTEDFTQAVGSCFARVCGLLAIVTLSSVIRVAVPSGADPDVHTHEIFFDLIGELGFRQTLTLPEELGPSRGVIAYDKTLF